MLHRTGGAASAVTRREPKARHGRQEVRLLWALADPFVNQVAGTQGQVGAPWPHLGQGCRVERRRTVRRHGQTHQEVEVSYAITSRPPQRADAATLLRALRGHWSIENRLHWVRDVTLEEDRSQGRTGHVPQVLATCRNLARTLLRRARHTNIAAALRTYASRPPAAVALVLQVACL